MERLDTVAFVSAVAIGFVTRAVVSTAIGPRFPFHTLEPQRTKWSLAGFFVGHLWDEITKQHGPMLGDAHRHWTQDVTKTVLIRIGNMPTIGTAHPADIQHILIGNINNWPKDEGYKILTRLLGDGLVTQYDDNNHALHRKELAAAFAPNALKLVSEECIPAHAATMLDTLKKHCEKSMREKKPVAISDSFIHAALRIIAHAAFKVRDPETLDLIEQTFNQAFEDTWSLSRLNSTLDKLMVGPNRRVVQARNRLKKIVERITRMGLSQSAAEGNGKTLIDYILLSDKLSPDAIFDHSITFLGAGFDTTANALTWFSMWIAKHPQVQEKLYEELSSAIGLDAIPTVDTLRHCTYLYNCCRETLRYFNPVNAFGRENTLDDVLPGTKTFVPAHTRVVVMMHATHRHPALWGPTANEFIPERWEDPAVEKLAETAFLPFSQGRRNCIGKDFAMNEFKVLAAILIRNFKLGWPEGQPIPDQIGQPVIRPTMPFLLNISPRS
jgi:cytochrome P450